VWKGPLLAVWGVHTSLPCTEKGLGVETRREAYTATGVCSPRSLDRWYDCCGWCAVGLSCWAACVGSDIVLGPFHYVCRLDSVC
jgi:hypothetical protein